MSVKLLIASAALLVALAGIGLQLFHMHRDPDVPEIGSGPERFSE